MVSEFGHSIKNPQTIHMRREYEENEYRWPGRKYRYVCCGSYTPQKATDDWAAVTCINCLRQMGKDGLTSKELNILLYLEDALVNAAGLLEAIKMNEFDWDVINRMKNNIIVERQPMAEITRLQYTGKTYSHVVTKFSSAAWYLVHTEREARTYRLYKSRDRELKE